MGMSFEEYKHEYFKSIRSGGLNWSLFPMKLYQLGKKLFWDPANIDLSKDAEDWKKLNDLEKMFIINVGSKFAAGEEAVALDLHPLIVTLVKEGRVEEVMYLEQFVYEESKHVEAFRRFFDIVNVMEDLSAYTKDLSPNYKKIFYEELPKAMWNLSRDPSPENQVRAVVTYNLIVEGVAAEGGYNIFRQITNTRKILPGLAKMVNLIATDESRHIAFGIYLITRLVKEYGEGVYKTAMDHINYLAPYAIGIFSEPTMPQVESLPFNLTNIELVDYAKKLLNTRIDAINRAKQMKLEMLLPKDLDVIESW
ncbi:R2-like ligand-binding oxidase [Saccharolobus islandicus]|uniref:Ribonucleotide reductase, beta subunit n=2 Tax=Saccharolobus islandicus TaxID=43080 RepID=M9U412_SACIS|nr:R2-like ligand-binding oxidase [Sulfolobus islandicus]ADX84388.1 ribonucleotide reductase [Sulfolobus islandicus REY15A]AGJ61759.1 Ribonucleotide reductase, beta subunit [Sulfolobus islandicus LAL14/1]